jgi:hypothetical protein
MSLIRIPRQGIVYLGQDEVNGAFYFYVNRQGGGRYVRHYERPIWCLATGMGNVINCDVDVPEDIVTDVQNLLQGTYDYANAPKTPAFKDRQKQPKITLTGSGSITTIGDLESPSKTLERQPEDPTPNIGPDGGFKTNLFGGVLFTTASDGQASGTLGADDSSKTISPGHVGSGNHDQQPKPRGRPVGSKNKPKDTTIVFQEVQVTKFDPEKPFFDQLHLLDKHNQGQPVAKKRGRPVGSKNKPKTTEPTEV